MERFLKSKLENGQFSGVSTTRSRIMSSIRGKGNKTTEVTLRLALVRAGISGWRLHAQDVPGRPDFFFPAQRLAVFVDGCFWHGCPKCGHAPSTRREFWQAKIKRNRQRDHKTKWALHADSIRTLRVWEHSLRDARQISRVIRQIQALLSAPVV
ncbi:MAG: very short patch repair endonuclease [Terriglobales bacterium]